jgi:prepilin-type N-terminal cleavage/methylation domain-containing protein
MKRHLQIPSRHAMRRLRRAAAGFTLLEVSVALAIIFIIISAVTIGRDVHRNAAYQRISSDFVQGWLMAYENYVNATGVVPGDNPAAPTGSVTGTATPELCDTELQAVMQAAGIAMPEGRAEGSANRYVYQDSNGNPQELRICFANVQWSEPAATPGDYVVRTRNVMILYGVTPALANMLDGQIDSRADARFGKMREQVQAALTTAASAPWSVDERMAYGSTVATALDESQVATVTALIKMNR